MDPSVILAQAGPSVAFLGLLIWFGRLYFTGRLVPKSEVDRMQQNFQQQIERERQISDDWREVAMNNTESLGKLTGQTDRLLEGQKTVETFILSLPRGGVGELPAIGSRQLSQGPGGKWQ
jgi:hypothetical protein